MHIRMLIWALLIIAETQQWRWISILRTNKYIMIIICSTAAWNILIGPSTCTNCLPSHKIRVTNNLHQIWESNSRWIISHKVLLMGSSAPWWTKNNSKWRWPRAQVSRTKQVSSWMEWITTKICKPSMLETIKGFCCQWRLELKEAEWTTKRTGTPKA